MPSDFSKEIGGERGGADQRGPQCERRSAISAGFRIHEIKRILVSAAPSS